MKNGHQVLDENVVMRILTKILTMFVCIMICNNN